MSPASDATVGPIGLLADHCDRYILISDSYDLERIGSGITIITNLAGVDRAKGDEVKSSTATRVLAQSKKEPRLMNSKTGRKCGQRQNRTADTRIFSPAMVAGLGAAIGRHLNGSKSLEADHLSLFTLARLTLGPNAFKRYLSLFCNCSRNLYVAELGSIALAVPQRPLKKLLQSLRRCGVLVFLAQ